MLSLCRSAPPEKCNWPVIITVFKSVKYSTAYIHKAESVSIWLSFRGATAAVLGSARTLGWRQDLRVETTPHLVKQKYMFNLSASLFSYSTRED